MNWAFYLCNLPKEIKLLIFFFLFALLFGYSASITLLINQTGVSPNGIEENYLGNEENEAAQTIKFHKSKFEMLTTIHSHIFTLGLIFFITGFLAYFTHLPGKFKVFLMIEPLISLVISFGSLLIMWLGWPSFKYLTYLSGGLMHTTFVITLLLLIRELFFLRTEGNV